MKQIDKIRPIIKNKFKDHPNFYKTYMMDNKLRVSFSDLVMAITPVGWDVFFVEVLHKLSPTEVQLAYAKLCRNKKELMDMLEKTRQTYEKPEDLQPSKRIGFRVDIKQKLLQRLKHHPKFIDIYEGYKKIFIVYEDILILIEPMGGTFYNWELFKRQGNFEVEHEDAGARIGFKKLIDVVVKLRKKCDSSK